MNDEHWAKNKPEIFGPIEKNFVKTLEMFQYVYEDNTMLYLLVFDWFVGFMAYQPL